MEASALQNPSAPATALVGRSPLLRLQGDEKLVALIRRGHHGAFEALVTRYESRLLSFCRHMLGSTEDAEDVLQEVFAAAFNAICADERPINARPWLYRIARNRCLNHLRRPVHSGQDSMDVFERDGGLSTADTVHRREEFRRIVADVQDLPETQRTALLLREIDALAYDQIAEAMDTTVPSIKSLLVRARVSLAEASEARLLSCEEVRFELGQVAEGLAKSTAPVRRHLKGCDRCRVFKGELRRSTRALAAIYPIGPLVILKKLLAAKLGAGALGGGSTASAGGSASVAGTGLAGGSSVASGAATASSAGGIMSFGGGALASKAAAGFVAAAIVTAGAVEVEHVRESSGRSTPATEANVEPPGDDRPLGGPLADAEDGRPQPAPGEEQPAEGEAGAADAEGAKGRDDEKDAAAAEGEKAGTEDEDAAKEAEGTKDAPAAPGAPAAGTTPVGTPPQPAPPREEHGQATVALPPHPPEGDVTPAPEAPSGASQPDGGAGVPDTGVDAVDDATPALP
ncbi:MAG: RNA polymerase sigma factor [Thermoleophilaceae bacterium]